MFFFLVMAGYPLILVLIGRLYWSDYRNLTERDRYTFRITDIYAFAIALTPTLLMLREVLLAWPDNRWSDLALLTAGIAGAQLTGIFICSLNPDINPNKTHSVIPWSFLTTWPFQPRGGWASAVRILAGGVIGFPLGCGAFCFASLIGCILMSLFESVGSAVFLLLLIVLAIVLAFLGRRAANTPLSPPRLTASAKDEVESPANVERGV